MSLSAIVLLGLLVDSASPKQQRDLAALQAVIESMCTMTWPGETLLKDKTESPLVENFLEGFDTEISRDLTKRGGPQKQIPTKFGCPAIRVASAARIDAAFDRASLDGSLSADPKSWPLRKDFPRAERIVTLSLPGFSTKGDLAFVVKSTNCPGLCGGDDLYMLQLRRGQWIVRRIIPISVS